MSQPKLVNNQFKGMRTYSVTGGTVDLSHLTSAEVTMLRDRLEKRQVSVTSVVQKLLDTYSTKDGKSALLLSVIRAQSVGTAKTSAHRNRMADDFFTSHAVVVNRVKGGHRLESSMDGSSKICRANVIYSETNKPSAVDMLKEQFAVRASAMLSVDSRTDGQKVVRANITKLPDVISSLDPTNGAKMMAVVCYDGINTDLPDAIYQETMHSDFSEVAGATRALYENVDVSIRKGLNAVGKGDKAFLFPFRAEHGNVPDATDELDAKNRIKILNTVYPGIKRGIGNYVASHIDGIPMSGSMRKKFSAVSDVVDVDADIYFVETTDPVLINALRTVLVKKGDNKVIFYRSNVAMKFSILAEHVVLEDNCIVKIMSSACLSGSSWLRVAKGIKTCYITFKDPTPPRGTTMLRVTDHARSIHNDRQRWEADFGIVQMYIDYRALAFNSRAEGDEEIRLLKASGDWNPNERYCASVRIGSGFAWYVTKQGKYTGEAMANAMATAGYHRIQYALMPITRHKFSGVTVNLKGIYNFCVKSMTARMPYIALDNSSELASFFDADELTALKTALAQKLNGTVSEQLDVAIEKLEEEVVNDPFTMVAPEEEDEEEIFIEQVDITKVEV